jgi:hypothetical protein
MISYHIGQVQLQELKQHGTQGLGFCWRFAPKLALHDLLGSLEKALLYFSLLYLKVYSAEVLYPCVILIVDLRYNWFCRIMHSIALYVPGNDEYGRMVRRTLMRYLNLTLILVLRSISSAVKRRFPTLDHLTEAGTVFRQVGK